ncbi:sigma 54-interacting transcriptional regulator [Pseudomonas chlororaphis]|uniref:sigma 54-interacting transcriptional regulator n=1 Tax=Pseudomonas chlororaphis TaxID=587753 RepID=UPI000F56A53C|nr:sigma-54 dependent transcriptional regulator [Pseudomonas chlororaphis]AZC83986.1 Formate hydrogenlyase transcriptional activator [Pseudomonas chlororaphis subsp. piscium]
MTGSRSDNHSLEHEHEVLNIVGTLQALIKKTAPLKIDIVLEGETGTGKDTLARRIHQLSRREGPLIALNCAAVPEQLAESELFGVMAGAYTGASKSRAGYIEASNHGTLYLDEIDSMPLLLQAKLLRVLETRGIERLGSTRFVPLDLRVIVATQTSLEKLVDEGKFRRDLFFRLNVIKIQLPTLSSNLQHIQPLFQRFVLESAERHQLPVPELAPHLLKCLLSHRWPGNIRELKYAAERFVLGIPALQSVEDLLNSEGAGTLKRYQRLFEKILIQDCLVRHDKCIDSVASELGIPRRTLYHRMKSLSIESPEL